MRTSTEDEAVKLFDEKYGIDFESRLTKLREEIDELLEAAIDMENNPCPLTISHFIDEASDVQGVLSHIYSIMRSDNDKALLNCIIKNKCREIDPNYLKTNKQ